VAGVVIAPVVPGAGADPILDFANTGRDRTGGRNYRTGIAPFVDVSAKLQNVDNRELFTVVAPAPDYWRVAALDRFTTENGGQWTLQAKGDEVEVGLPSAGPTGSFRQEFAIGPMGERWLPAAYRPVAIDLDDTLVVASSSTLVADAESVEGLRYTVDSVLPPDAASVTADMEAATAAPVPARLQPFTDVPAGMPDIIAITAREVVDAAGATTPYAQAAALRNYFRGGGFEYSLDVDPVDTPDAIAEFLRTKRGFCVQFSTAYAVMARSLGIPTRVAVGFTPGELRNGQFHVSAHDAHAWPEVWLAGMGWTHAFDPTPPADDHPESGGSAVPNEAAIPPPVQPVPAVTDPVTTLPTPEVTAPGAGTGAGTGTGSEAERGATQTAPPAATPAVAATAPGTGASPWLAAVLAVLAVLAAIGAYVAFVLVAKARQRARRRTGAPGDSVQGAWDEALDRLH
jgi:hypothetical protein